MVTDSFTNIVYFSSLLPEKCPILNAHITEELQKWGIAYGYLTGTKDIWCRDYMPVQIAKNRLVSYNYTPDYLQDKRHLRLQTNPVEVLQNEANDLLQILPTSTKKEMAFDGLRPVPVMKQVIKTIKTNLVIDGGNVVKCDDVIVMTDKVFVEHSDIRRMVNKSIMKQIEVVAAIIRKGDKIFATQRGYYE